MKEKINVTGVPETMIQTLYARACETEKKKPKIKDEMAVEIARTIVLDKMTEQYLSDNPGSIVLNIACGLDTRCHRFL